MNHFLALPAAVAESDSSIDFGVAAHYGNPIREQRSLSTGLAITDLSHRGVVTVGGPDRLSWLNSMTSQNMLGLEPGHSVETLSLDAQGHIKHMLHAVDDGEQLWLIVEGSDTEAVVTWLERMRFMLRVEISDRSADYAVLGAMTETVLDQVWARVSSPELAPAITWVDPWSSNILGGFAYSPLAGGDPADPLRVNPGFPGASWTMHERIIPRKAIAAVVEQIRSGVVETAGAIAYEALRIAAWRPRFAAEVDAMTLPHELDLLRTAVALNKGCYAGQETVAKVINLGRPPRRIVMLHLDGSDTILPAKNDSVTAVKVRPEPEPGVMAEVLTVGRVTSAAIHYELGPIALAIVKRAVPAALTLTVHHDGNEVPSSQDVIVPDDAGPLVEIPKLPRLSVMR